MARHSEKRDRRKILHLKDYQPEEPRAEIEYGEPEEEEASQEGGEKKKAWQAPKAFYRVAVILLAAVLVLALWVNRASLTPENIANWVRTQVMGAGEGDGYPVSITGSTVSEGNFLTTDGNAVLLSDTAFTVLSP